MKKILVRSYPGWMHSYTAYFNTMKILSLIILLACSMSLHAQKTLRDSLYGGKLKADTGARYVSNDTSKYVAPLTLKNDAVSPAVPGEKRNNDVPKLDEATMPDSLNKSYYARQKVWKRFIETNTQVISQQANDTKKVKKGEYQVEISYEIGVNGRVTNSAVTCNPPNEYLTEQYTELMKRAPVLAAPVYSDGKPRALPATQTVTISKK